MQAMRRNNPYSNNRGVRSDDYDSGENNNNLSKFLNYTNVYSNSTFYVRDNFE